MIQESLDSLNDPAGPLAPGLGESEGLDLMRFRAAVALSGDAVLFYRDQSNRFIDVNPRACQCLGYTREELLGMSPTDLRPHAPVEIVAAELDEVIQGRTMVGSDSVLLRRKDGTEFAARWRMRAMSGGEHPVVVIVATEEAGLDPLTRLPDRRIFDRHLGRALERSRRQSDVAVAVLFIDLNGFKAINDRFGHRAGDRLLTDVASRLTASVRPGDLVARRGGDEFTILLENVSGHDEAVRVAERIKHRMNPPAAWNGQSIPLAASIGIALADHLDTTTADALLERADRAMYRAKATGEGSYQLA